MSAIVANVEKGSIAEELEISKGDELISIDGVVPKDLIEYRYLIMSELVTLLIKKTDGEEQEIEIEKDYEDDLGIIFESAVFDRIKLCANNCIFCFVNQQPKGMRETLYIKDDDYRLSYLQGTYITLTNLTKADKQRIKRDRLGPLYVSVHTTNPELREKMLNNKMAGKIIDNLRWLKSIDIPIHAQIVLCPTFNDDVELERTLNDLKEFKDILLSVAVVPVGITQYRETPLVSVDRKVATKTIELIDKFNREMKKQIACASDEFFLMAQKPVPERKYYGSFAQLEDGVGALRLVLDDFDKRKKKLPKRLKTPKKLHLVTSVAAGSIFKDIIAELNKIRNLEISLEIIKSNFWGKDVNVTGLVVGKDIISQLSEKKDEIRTIIIPSIMLKPMSESFLDDVTISDIQKELDCKVLIVQDIYSTKDLIKYALR